MGPRPGLRERPRCDGRRVVPGLSADEVRRRGDHPRTGRRVSRAGRGSARHRAARAARGGRLRSPRGRSSDAMSSTETAASATGTCSSRAGRFASRSLRPTTWRRSCCCSRVPTSKRRSWPASSRSCPGSPRLRSRCSRWIATRSLSPQGTDPSDAPVSRFREDRLLQGQSLLVDGPPRPVSQTRRHLRRHRLLRRRSRRRSRPSRTTAGRARSRIPRRGRRSTSPTRRCRDRRSSRSSTRHSPRRAPRALRRVPPGAPCRRSRTRCRRRGAAPELERRGRRLVEPREVLEVAAERVPALGLERSALRPTSPELAARGGAEEHSRVDERGQREPEQHHVAPPRVDGAPAVDRDEREHRPDRHEQDDPGDERHQTERPAPVCDLAADGRLEALEPRRHRRAFVLDLLPELRQAPAASVEHVVHHRVDRLLPGRQLDRRALGDLEVGDSLGAEPGPDAPLRRDGLRGVVAAPDQVEQRRGELERARLAPWPSSVGTSAAAVSVGGSCSYSRS